LELWWSLLMRSETTADISDSIAPSMATVTARPQQPVNQVGAEAWDLEVRQPCGMPPKRADGLYRQIEEVDGRRAYHESHNRAGDPVRDPTAHNKDGDCGHG
jgi:hypothetical protein